MGSTEQDTLRHRREKERRNVTCMEHSQWVEVRNDDVISSRDGIGRKTVEVYVWE